MEAEKVVSVPCDKMEKPNYMLMSLKRILLLFVIFASVIVVVYYTPMPEEYFEDCDRECHELDWPMICRVKLVLEVYKTLSKPCGSCTEPAGGACPDACISADGRERGVLTANRQLPAPRLHVCQNDILVVDVVHRAPAHALAVHWRGQPQRETPFMDGAPMITQCPQPAYTTFQYKFRASAAGTHMYHAHSAADAADGLAGALVVRQSPRADPLRRLYDVDATEHTLFVSEWGHSMGPLAGTVAKIPNVESLLINGKGRTADSPDAPLSRFLVAAGKRYRFRLAYGGGTKSCAVTVCVERHALRLVALDGHVIAPQDVDCVQLGRGERADFIVETRQTSGVYRVVATADRACQADLGGEAELVYDSDVEASGPVAGGPVAGGPVAGGAAAGGERAVFSTLAACAADVRCLREARAAERLPAALAGTVDETIYVPFNYSIRRISAKRMESWGQTDGHRFTYPASPLLTQPSDVPAAALCGAGAGAAGAGEAGAGEECVHVKSVPLGSTVELVLFDQGGESDHIFHLHGYSFHVVALATLGRGVQSDELRALHEGGSLFQKNLVDPVVKDTIVVPKFGAVALRLKADNPGYWMMRDERSSHWTRGLDFVLKVGAEADFVQAPVDFPKCGSYVGPEYFLI